MPKTTVFLPDAFVSPAAVNPLCRWTVPATRGYAARAAYDDERIASDDVYASIDRLPLAQVLARLAQNQDMAAS